MLKIAQRVDSDELNDFRTAMLAGLSRPRKSIPSKFFYDTRGSQLFELICQLDEYYLTRTEVAILKTHRDVLAKQLPSEAIVIEFGSGSSVKIRMLLDALDRPACYVPIDISGEHLRTAAGQLAHDYPSLQVCPVNADFTRPFRLPDDLPPGPRVGFFPGSTIGNFRSLEAIRILSTLARELGPEGKLLIGVDLKKSERLLRAAYNDAVGVTAEFNLNLLVRANRELQATFDVAGFRHHACYDSSAGRIEMYLISRHAQAASVAGLTFRFAAGERILTEESYKYGIDEFVTLATAAGYWSTAVFTDPQQLFSVHLLSVLHA